MNFIADVIILTVVMYATVTTIKTLADLKIRLKLIDKGIFDENVKYYFAAPQANKENAAPMLKWGMVLLGIGLAIMIGLVVPAKLQAEMTIAAMFILAGIALLVYYFKASPKNESQNQ